VGRLVGLDCLTWQVSTLGRHVDALGHAPGPHLGDAGRGSFGPLVPELEASCTTQVAPSVSWEPASQFPTSQAATAADGRAAEERPRVVAQRWK
jgi:hypothetical protein